MDNERDAILELSKGKLITDAENHAGEGIFFTSRVFDEFAVISGGLFFSHKPIGDWIQSGVDPYTIQRLLGHKTFSNTKRYSHHCVESSRRGIELFEKLKEEDKRKNIAQV